MQIVAQNAELGLHFGQMDLGTCRLVPLCTQGFLGLNMSLQAGQHDRAGCQCTGGGTGEQGEQIYNRRH